MKTFICYCNFYAFGEWEVSCSSVEEARKCFLMYLTERLEGKYISWIKIYELVHDEHFEAGYYD